MTAPTWLVDLLAEHELHDVDLRCECGFGPLYGVAAQQTSERHRAHVAEAVWAALVRRFDRANLHPDELTDALGGDQ